MDDRPQYPTTQLNNGTQRTSHKTKTKLISEHLCTLLSERNRNWEILSSNYLFHKSGNETHRFDLIDYFALLYIFVCFYWLRSLWLSQIFVTLFSERNRNWEILSNNYVFHKPGNEIHRFDLIAHFASLYISVFFYWQRSL